MCRLISQEFKLSIVQPFFEGEWRRGDVYCISDLHKGQLRIDHIHILKSQSASAAEGSHFENQSQLSTEY